MAKIRELVRKITVGDYSFDLKVNREIVRKAFAKFPRFWELFAKSTSRAVARFTDGQDMISDLDSYAKILDENDEMDSLLPDFCKFVIKDMAADSGVDIDEFIRYCEDNYVWDTVCYKIYEFAMMGFRGDKGVVKTQKAKVSVTLD